MPNLGAKGSAPLAAYLRAHWLVWLSVFVAVVGAGFSLHISQYVGSSHEKLLAEHFRDDADQYAEAIVLRVEAYTTFLTSLRAFVYGADRVERHDFKNYVSLVLQKHFSAASGIQAVEWIPRIRLKDRAAHEQATQKEGFGAYRVTEQDEKHNLVPAKTRPEYFPVSYVEPMRSNEKALGFDLASNPVRRQALEKAAATGQSVCTERLVLVQEKESLPGFLIICPCYDQPEEDLTTPAARREHLLGFTLLVLRATDFLSSALQTKRQQEAALYLYEPDGQGGTRLLAACSGTGAHAGLLPSRSAPSAPDYLTSTREIQLPGKTWRLTFVANRQVYETSTGAPAAAYLALGFGLTLLASCLCLALNKTARQHARIQLLNSELEQRVQERTAEAMGLYQNAPCGYHTLKPDGLVTRMNDTELAWLGYRREEIEGRLNILELVAHEARNLFREQLAQTRKTGALHDVELPLRRKDGTMLMALINAKGIYDQAGQFTESRASVVNITQRKKAEMAMQQMSERLSLATRAGGVGIWDHDLAADRLVWDAQMFRLYGLGADQLTGAYEAWLNGVHPDDRERCHEEVQAALRGERDFDTEFRVLWPDGSVHNIRAQGIVGRDPRGKPSRIIGTNWDITPWKKLEAALISSEARFRRLFEQAPFPLSLYDQNGAVLYLNESFTGTFGYRSEDIPTTEAGWQRSFPDKDYRRQIQSRWEAAVSPSTRGNERVEPIECRLTCLDGSVRDVLVSGVNFGAEILATYVDVTAFRQADAQLRKLWQAVKHSSSMLLITDETGRIEYANPAWEQTTGHLLADVEGERLSILKSGAHDAEFYRQIWGEISAGKIWRGEFCNRRKDGSLYWIFSSIAPVYNETGKITHFVSIEEDVSKRKEAESQLRKAKEGAEAASRAKSTFLANVSHEIRTPMNVILGFSQLLLREPALTAVQRQYLNSIRQSGAHLLELINDLLEMARIESGRTIMRPEDFDLPGLLQDLGNLFHERATAKGLRFELWFDDGLPRWIRADATKLRQVLLNILGNAVKFTERGRICLRVRSEAEPGGTLRIQAEVEDTGCGISEDEASQLFSPFFQTKAGMEAKGGTGLGLAISRELVRLMGGDLTLSSEVGKGTIFHCEIQALPAKKPLAATLAEERRQASYLQPPWPGTEVLVIDDEQANREILLRLLTAVGFGVHTAADGAQALTQFELTPPLLVLVDIRMPVMDGIATIRELRSRYGAAIAIVALSASVYAEDRERALAAGADSFMAKPFMADELFELIKQRLGVEYSYALMPAVPPRNENTVPASTGVRHLSAEWVSEFRAALKRAEYERLLALTEKLASTDAALAGQFRELIERFDHKALEARLST